MFSLFDRLKKNILPPSNFINVLTILGKKSFGPQFQHYFVPFLLTGLIKLLLNYLRV